MVATTAVAMVEVGREAEPELVLMANDDGAHAGASATRAAATPGLAVLARVAVCWAVR